MLYFLRFCSIFYDFAFWIAVPEFYFEEYFPDPNILNVKPDLLPDARFRMKYTAFVKGRCKLLPIAISSSTGCEGESATRLIIERSTYLLRGQLRRMFGASPRRASRLMVLGIFGVLRHQENADLV